MLRKTSLAVAVALATLGAAGCATKASTGALIGTGAGAGAGYLIGKKSGSGGTGAAIGGAAGAAGGYMIGNEMDKRDQDEREQYYHNDPYYR